MNDKSAYDLVISYISMLVELCTMGIISLEVEQNDNVLKGSSQMLLMHVHIPVPVHV